MHEDSQKKTKKSLFTIIGCYFSLGDHYMTPVCGGITPRCSKCSRYPSRIEFYSEYLEKPDCTTRLMPFLKEIRIYIIYSILVLLGCIILYYAYIGYTLGK